MQQRVTTNGRAATKPPPTRSKSGRVKSVERALLLLTEFGKSGPELGVTEASKTLGLHKSTVSRLLATLEHAGFVEQIRGTGRYRLGLQIVSLAGLAVTQLDLTTAARPHLASLAEQSEETVTLSVLDGNEAVNIDQVPGPHPVTHLGWIGRRLPLHASAAGKPLLAGFSADQFEEWRQQPVQSFTEQTVISAAMLLDQLRLLLLDGYVIVSEEYEPGLTAIGAPVYDYHSEIVGSITVSGPSFRLGPKRLPTAATLTRHTAQRISAQLGYTALHLKGHTGTQKQPEAPQMALQDGNETRRTNQPALLAVSRSL